MAVEVDLSDIYVGEDRSLVFTIFQSDGATKETITDWEFEFSLADRPWSEPEFTVTDSSMTVDEANSKVTVPISASQLSLSAGTYYFSLNRVGSGVFTVLSEGEVPLQAAPQS